MPSIYKHFSTHTLLPIKLEDIKTFILNTGEATIIARYPVDINELHLHGMLRVFRDKPPYAVDERVIAQIAYYSELAEDYVRLVCTKEMLHLLDNHAATASTQAGVSQLIEDITLPLEAVASIPGLSDHTKLANALCVLVPSASRRILKAELQDGKLSTDDIARLSKVPEPFIRLVMSDRWDAFEASLCSN